MKKLLFLLAITACLTAKSQCTNVCIKSGTITTVPSGTQTVAGTVTVSAKGNYNVATTYSFVTVSGINNITSGALSVSVANVGDNTALFDGTGLPPGAILNIEIPNATLPAYTYDCLTSSLLVLINR